jgi:hypothetical protein
VGYYVGAKKSKEEHGLEERFEKFQVSCAARNFRVKRERWKIPSAAEGGLTMESAKLQASKQPC